MKILTSSQYLLATAALLAFVGTAPAATIPEITDCQNITSVYKADGTAGQFYGGTGAEMLYDGDFESGLIQNDAGSYFVINFTIWNANGYYVSEITVGHLGNVPYTIQYSEDGTAWLPLADAQNVTTSGQTTYDVKGTVKKLKYIFDAVEERDESITEFQVKGYEPPEEQIISKRSLAAMHYSNGSLTANNGTEGFGGGVGIQHLFNGSFTDDVYIGPNGRLDNGGYVLVDFSSEMPGGYYITKIKTGCKSTHRYSLYYSVNGTTWSSVEGGTSVSFNGTKTFNVNDIAVYVKCVFDQVGGWTPSFCELQVWGLDPDDVPCTHPSYTAWETVAGSATCLKPGIDVQFCTVCGERVTRESTTLPALGHDYVDHLEEIGRVKAFGHGYITCSRCDFRLDFPEPINLVTNKVNGEQIGGVKSEGAIHFLDVSATSTGDTGYGVRPGHLINGLWDWGWNHYWYSDGHDADPHVDYEFGTEIDLVYVDISLKNETHFVAFFRVDDDTGLETQLTQFEFIRTDNNPAEDPVLNPHNRESFDMLPIEEDDEIEYQRFKVHFFETPIRHLRIRQFAYDGQTLKKPMQISELHPWGTVRGAGDIFAEKTTLIMLK